MRKRESKIATRLAGCKINQRISRRINTKQIDYCPNCNCMTFVMMDDDGNRYCGKCKQYRLKGVL